MDGVATPQEYVNRAVELGMPAIAITDHGTLSGHREMYRIAKEAGIKPILGIFLVSQDLTLKHLQNIKKESLLHLLV